MIAKFDERKIKNDIRNILDDIKREKMNQFKFYDDFLKSLDKIFESANEEKSKQDEEQKEEEDSNKKEFEK